MKANVIYILIVFIGILFAGLVYGQEAVRFTIRLNDIDKDKLLIYYDNGLRLEPLVLDKEDAVYVFDRPSYTIHPRLQVSYDHKVHRVYFIESDTAMLNLQSHTLEQPFESVNSIHITPVYDSVSNALYGDLRAMQYAQSSQIPNLFKQYQTPGVNKDSVKYELLQLHIALSSQAMDYLRAYSDDFFSYYYFIDQIVRPLAIFGSSFDFSRKLLTYFNTTFPAQFRDSEEGKRIVVELEQRLSPVLLSEGERLPIDDLFDLEGNKIDLINTEKEYILLDFWASWCGPCLQQIPDLKALRDQFSENQMKIISISIDRDSVSFANAVKENNMNWEQRLDQNGLISTSLGVNSVPTVLMVDRNGVIKYYKNGGRLDVARIKAILEGDE